LSDELFKLGLIAGAAARGRHEGGHSDIDAKPALDRFLYHASDDSLVVERGLERAPILRPLDFDGRKRVVPFVVAPVDADYHLVAGLDQHFTLFVTDGGDGQDAVILAAKVDEHGFGIDGYDRAVERLAPAAAMLLLELRKDIGE